MAERVFLVHGWSVAQTTTYQALHLKLAEAGFDLTEIYLGRYVSLDDHVEIKDIATAMHNALKKQLGVGRWQEPFHIITHSTGALVAKEWVIRHYTGKFCENKPLRNLIFLAGPHFGSRLAHHGRSMISHLRYLGDTGNQVLTALELGSEFSWQNNELWLDRKNWKRKGVRPYCIIGDRIDKSFKEKMIFAEKIFPAAYEKGSDEVVRAAAGNLNFRRYLVDAANKERKMVGEIHSVPFVALKDYTHSGDELGIMNSIRKSAKPSMVKYQNLKLILDCLAVKSEASYERVRDQFAQITELTRAKRKPFAQLDFRFRDITGAPIDDYVVTLGAKVNGEDKASKTVAHTHKNKATPNHFTVFIDLKEFEPHLTYFLKFDSKSHTELFSYAPDPYQIEFEGTELTNVISENQTTQIDVILDRTSSEKLFLFHKGTDDRLHVKWDREGNLVEENKEIK
ncbi:MAG: hypothetical protein P1R58_04435 [bacterium]|nr:hypothetical protein [bacterium]